MAKVQTYSLGGYNHEENLFSFQQRAGRSRSQKVIEILNLPDEIVQMEDESGLGTKLNYRLRWSRTNLKSRGQIKNIKRGTWSLD